MSENKECKVCHEVLAVDNMSKEYPETCIHCHEAYENFQNYLFDLAIERSKPREASGLYGSCCVVYCGDCGGCPCCRIPTKG